MQWLAMILPFIFRRLGGKSKSLRETAHEIFEEVVYKSRRVVTLTLVGVAAVIFFCGGLFISILDSSTQYDRAGHVAFTATLGSGLGLIVLAAATFAVVFLRAWPSGVIEQKEEEPTRHAPSTLESALAALVMDFVKEREMRREQRRSRASAGFSEHEKKRSTDHAEKEERTTMH